MGRGKLAMKKIENSTNRQVTYSKRRKGLFKKADELTALCDAKVSIIMFSSSSSGKLSEYISDNITTKEIFDRYQKALGKDLWSTKYEKMQEELRKQREKNNRLKREMMRRMGEDLSDLNFLELHRLEQEMEASFKIIREQLLKKISSQTMTLKKKNKNYGSYYSDLKNNHVHDVEPKLEDVYGIVENEGQYGSAVADGGSNLYPFRLHHPHLHCAAVFEPHQFHLV